MKNKYLINLIMTPLFLGGMSSVYGQGGTTPPPEVGVYSKIGKNPYNLNRKAALEVESTERGFLPPRMTMVQRDAISLPIPAGLIVWCTDCDDSSSTKKGQFCVYADDKWVAYSPSAATIFNLTTGRKGDAVNAPVRNSNTSATISGTLVNISRTAPTETGIVYREITGGDYVAFPSLTLDASGNNTVAVAPDYKAVNPTTVTTAGGTISATINLNSATGNTKPYYFRTYARSPSGISYGNTVIFNVAPPTISKPIVVLTNGNSLLPVFIGKLTVNAGSPRNTITEYGYCTSTTNPNPTTTADDKVVLSATPAGIVALDNLNDKLDSETFTANPAISLLVNDYNVKSLSKTYFRYYAVANGEPPVYSDAVSFTPVADPTTGGSAMAVFLDSSISQPLKISEVSASKILARFNVIRSGNYSFTVENPLGATTGLSIASPVTGSFAAADTGTTKTVEFSVTGTPRTSLEGNTFKLSGITTPLSTGAILPAVLTGGNAICDGTRPTAVVEITSPSGAIWMDRNLGASRAARSRVDFRAYGCMFQWGRGNDGAASMNWTSDRTGTLVNTPVAGPVTSDTPGKSFITGQANWQSATNNNLWQGVKGINNPCPAGFRLPTYAEFNDEITINNITDYSSAYDSPLKFVSEYYIDDTDKLIIDYYRGVVYQFVGESGNLNKHGSVRLDSSSGNTDNSTAYGTAVRCIKDASEPVVTGGNAVADFKGYAISKRLKAGEASAGKFLVRFNIIQAGNYSFTVTPSGGATTGLSIASPVTGSFAVADTGTIKTLEFPVTGTPGNSLEGNTFTVSGITTPLNTGTVLPLFKAICDLQLSTAVVEVVFDAAGRKWMDRNLGASRAATSVDDYQAFGCLYQWGRGNDGAASMNWISTTEGIFINGMGYRTDAVSGSDSPSNQFIETNSDWRSLTNNALWQGVNSTNNPCPLGFRLPTKEELVTALVGVTNSATAYTSTLKLVSSPYMQSNGILNSGYGYWSSTSLYYTNAYGIKFNTYSTQYEIYSFNRGDGLSVRCIKDY